MGNGKWEMGNGNQDMRHGAKGRHPGERRVSCRSSPDRHGQTGGVRALVVATASGDGKEMAIGRWELGSSREWGQSLC